jgi:hypothetical protein
MSLDQKLQIPPGQRVAVEYAPVPLDLEAAAASSDHAEVVIVFVTTEADLAARTDLIVEAAGRHAVTWVAYPKAKQLSTDLNRDVIRRDMASHGLNTVRQIAVDAVWSALRLTPV